MSTGGSPDATAPNAATAQARVLADELARGGVRHVVVCPGSRSAALAIAVHEDPRLTVHVHPDERSAAYVALGVGRATGVPAAVVVTSGTAVANLHPAAVEADAAGVPLLLLTADRPPEMRDTGANQTIAQRDLLGPGLRWAHELGVAEDRPDAVRTWRAVFARAVAAARGALGAAPGPVHLNVPTREPTVPVGDDGRTSAAAFTTPLDGRPASAPWTTVRTVPRDASAGPVDELAVRFAAVERGLIVVGDDVGGPGVSAAAVDAVSRATGWPVLAEGQVPARHGERALRAGSWLAADARFAAAHRPDLVLRLGRPTVQASWRALVAVGEQLLVDAHGGWHDPWRGLGEVIVADPGALLTAVAERLATRAGSDWWGSWAAADAAAASAVADVVAAGPDLTGAAVAHEVLAAVPAGASLVVGASLPVRDVDLAPAVRPDVRMLANRGAAGIDGTVSTALGTAVATDLPTWALLGDHTLLHDTNGLLLQPGSPEPSVTLVCVDNGGGRVFDGLPPGRHAPALTRLFTAPHGRDLAAVGRSHGLEVAVASDRPTLAAALAARAGDGRGTSLVVARVDPAADAESRARTAAAVAAAVAAA